MRIAHRIGALLIAGALSLSLAVAAQAQRGGGRRATVVPRTWLTRLNLTEEQKTKVEAAGQAYRTELQSNAASTPQERRQASRKARETYETALNAALSADQQKQLAAWREEARQYPGMGQLASALVGLNLTDEQKTKVKAIGAKYQPELMKFRAELRTAADRQAVQAQITAVNAKVLDEVKAVLTPEQVQKLPEPRRRRQQ